MLFSGIPFIFYFLAAVLVLYFAAPGIKIKNIILLAFSLIFYGWGEPKYVVLMIISVLCGYVFGIMIEKSDGKRRKLYMIISVTVSLSFLGYFKYADFFIENFNMFTGSDVKLLNVVLPIGISFYTFQIISYTLDVYAKRAEASRDPLKLALYISMFPQLIAGPIVRYTDIYRQIDDRDINTQRISLGIRRFVTGLGKKVLISNVLGEFCAVFATSGELSVLYVWVYAAVNALQIYYDFSGYSDMAIGLGKILGFDIPENFNYPFVSSSATEFWRRWHISLGSWFRDYVYIPLGGNRVGKFRHVVNILVVWLLTGVWHGADWNFMIWGVYFGILLILEKFFILDFLEGKKITAKVWVTVTVLVSFVIFNTTDMERLGYLIRCMAGLEGIPLVTEEFVYYLKSYGICIIIAAVGATPVVKNAVEKMRNNPQTEKFVDIAEPLFLLAVMVLATAYLVDGAFNPFLYFRF